VQLVKSFELDKEVVERIVTEVSGAERAGLSAKLAAADGAARSENAQLTLIEDCRLVAVAKAAAEAEAARQARAAMQVVSRPSSSLSVAQALLDVDQVSPALQNMLISCVSIVAADFPPNLSRIHVPCRQSRALQVMTMTLMVNMMAVAHMTIRERALMQSPLKVHEQN
jgi:hypothetical protein